MMATLADIRSKPSTPNRVAAAANIERGIANIAEAIARIPRGGERVRNMTFHDKECLMLIADDSSRPEAERDRAKYILAGNGDITRFDALFIDRATGKH
jgi:hypothetical protein